VIKAVLFDMGSTLLEFENQPWEELIRRGIDAIYDALDGRGTKLPARQAFCQQFHEAYRLTWKQAEQSLVEMRVADLVEQMAQELGLLLAAADLLELVRAHYRPVSAQVTMYADTVATLAALRQRGLKIGLVSNTMWPGHLHKEDLERFGLLDFFDHLVFSADLGVRKPHPQIFRAALQALAVRPSQAVFVGDRFPEDVAGAKGVGMWSVWKERPDRARHPAIRPDACIVQLRELPGLIDSWMQRDGA
jgi:putative hydrolase of the HAD superfamily